MEDEYEMIKKAFKHLGIKEEGNLILKLRKGDYLITFYFTVDYYETKRFLDDIIVEKVSG